MLGHVVPSTYAFLVDLMLKSYYDMNKIMLIHQFMLHIPRKNRYWRENNVHKYAWFLGSSA